MSDGRILFSATGIGTYLRASQIFAVSADDGLPTEFPTPYGANPTLSANGKFRAYTPHSTDTRTWKRYRGGMETDIWVYDLTNSTAKRVTQWEGTDTIPMGHGDTQRCIVCVFQRRH
jgi:tricorn protease